MPNPLVRYKSIRYGQLRYYVTIEQVGVLRTPEGDIPLNTEIAGAIALEMMDAAIEQLNATRVRFETGRLEAALRDPRSHYVRRNEIGMFVANFLDEEAPYWRAIDRGSKRAVIEGRIISGVFQDSPLEYTRPSIGTATPFLAEARGVPGGFGQSLHRAGQTKTNRRTSEAASFGRALLRAAGMLSSDRKVTGQIRHEIKPHRFVAAARRAFNQTDAKKLAADFIRNARKQP